MTHWTERSTEDYLYSIVADFALQIEELCEEDNLEEGFMEEPETITLEKIIKLARSKKMKVALVAYDDNDPDNERGPVNADIFRICWEKCGKPTTFFDLEET
jgi:hypothetical protein